MRSPVNRVRLLPLLGAACILASCMSVPLVNQDGSPNGRAIYEQRCTQCHARLDPRDYSDAQWAQNVARYAPRAGIRPEWRPAVVTWLQQANDPARSRQPAKALAGTPPQK